MSARVVVMGVSGSGKTTVAEKLADRIGAALVEGDDLHPQANRDKMRSGTPLTDDDRWPWLDRVAAALESTDGPVVVTCSALKRAYRDRLRAGAPGTFFVHLDGDPQLLKDRQAAREGHFMPPSLMDSQLDTLEQLGADEAGVRLDVAAPPERLADEAAAAVRDHADA
ncbi:gluconokinase [Marmoricola endophyticus]|uniref:Gluconokinase n=1 Tax=Marmoricola endophyticus TaxID=2040280 RepID=A0A917EZY6_9ACTN|nr:gluconokinase [Marmoricola endophyticus]GGF38310.1 gluconokinase [Marmoricola endophyticus]